MFVVRIARRPETLAGAIAGRARQPKKFGFAADLGDSYQ
jgi:hypothetical protein